ncbi:MAG: hypothetical protein N3D11_02575 [Candidatus Sumerlaeia bacterium]|nr:hypothetical protein [Candidatus Sumerlaeia bacterium]
MTRLWPDTSPDVEDLLIQKLRELPAWRKPDMVGQMNDAVRTLITMGLRHRHPPAAPEQLRRAMADLLLGPELAAKVYEPWEPTEMDPCSPNPSK